MPFDGPAPVAMQRSRWLALMASGFHGRRRPAIRPVLPVLPVLPVDTNPLQILKTARQLIANEQDWVQTHYIFKGRRCAVGALRKARTTLGVTAHDYAEAHSMLLDYARELGFRDVEKMNDDTTHRKVIHAFDVVINRASAQAHSR